MEGSKADAHGLRRIIVTKVVNPSSFEVKDVTDAVGSAGARLFNAMEEALNRDFQSESFTVPVREPTQGELLAGRRTKELTWVRVEFLEAEPSSRGPMARCKLKDYGNEEIFNMGWLRPLPEKFRRVPFQVQQCALWGVVPCTMAIRPDLTIGTDTATSWDQSASILFRTRIRDSIDIMAEFVGMRQNSEVALIRLHFVTSDGLSCFNDELVARNYAVFGIREEDKIAVPSLTSSSGLDVGEEEDFHRHPPPTVRLKTVSENKREKEPAVSRSPKSSPSSLVQLLQRLSEERQPPYPADAGKQPHFPVSKSATKTLSPSTALQHHLGLSACCSGDKPAASSAGGGRLEVPSADSATLQTGRGVPDGASDAKPRWSQDPTVPKRPEAEPAPRKQMTLDEALSRIDQVASGGRHLCGKRGTATAEERTSKASLHVDSPAKMSSRRLMALLKPSPGDSPCHSVSGSEEEVRTASPSPSTQLRKPLGERATAVPRPLPKTDASCSSGSSSDKPRTFSAQRAGTKKLSGHKLMELLKSPHRPVGSSGSSVASGARSPSDSAAAGGVRPLVLPPPAAVPRGRGRGVAAFLDCLSPSDRAAQEATPCRQRRQMPSTAVGAPRRTSGSSSEGTSDSSLHSRSLDFRMDVPAASSPRRSASSDTAVGAGTARTTPDCRTSGAQRRPGTVPLPDQKKRSGISLQSPPLKLDPQWGRGRGEPGRKGVDPDQAARRRGRATVSASSEGELAASDGVEDSVSEGKALGELLLKQMKANTMSRPAQYAERPDQRWKEPSLGLVHGLGDIKPVLSLEAAPLGHGIKKILHRKAVMNRNSNDAPMVIQAHCWPAVSRGVNVVGLAPRKYGKTLAYLLPLLTQIRCSSSYLGLPVGCGPKVIILVPSWIKVQELQEMCKEFIEKDSHIRCLAIYAAGAEESMKVPLMNGCDILVATLSCLIRQLDQGYTELNRLCHLVLDEADLLVEEQTGQLRNLMTRYAFVLKEQRVNDLTPRQLLVFSSRWTAGIESFVQAYMSSPSVFIDSTFESSVYGKVEQVVHVVEFDQRVALVVKLLRSLATDAKRLVIFTSEKDEAEELVTLVRDQLGLPVLLAHHMMLADALDQIRHEWLLQSKKGKSCILVCTDTCFNELQPRDVDIVVSYDLPRSKTTFGNRMASMRNHFFDITKPHALAVRGQSHILVTEKCVHLAQSLMDLLKRSNAPIPKEMLALISGYQEAQIDSRDTPLCYFLKAFGSCLKGSGCKERHKLIPEADCRSSVGELPLIGEVEMLVTHVVNASCAYVQLLQLRPSKEMPSVNLKLHRIVLESKIKRFFKENGKTAKVNPQVGDVCAVHRKGKYYRVKICNFVKTEREGNYPSRATVWFCDCGQQADMLLTDILHLPEELCAIPFQAVEMFICQLRPMDQDIVWTCEANDFMDYLSEDKTLWGRVVLSLGNTLWVDKLMEWEYDHRSKLYKLTTDVCSELLNRPDPIARQNPQHIANLYKLCMSCVDIPKILRRRYLYGQNKALKTEVLPDGPSNVCVCHFVHPSLFFVHRADRLSELRETEAAIEETMRQPVRGEPLSQGCLCILQQLEESGAKWLRGQVMTKVDDLGEVKVFLLDRGHTVTSDLQSLYDLPWKYKQLPAQAIQCCLGLVKATGGEWSTRTCEAMQILVRDLTLTTQVIEVQEGIPECDACYVVDLYDTHQFWDTRLAQELVWRGLAVSGSEEIQSLLPKPSNESGTEKQIASLCCSLHWAEEEEEVLRLAEEIHQTAQRHCGTEEGVEALVGSDQDVSNLVALVSYVENLQAHRFILEAVAEIVNADDRLAEKAAESLLAINIMHGMDQVERPTLQSQLVWLFSQVAKSKPLQASWDQNPAYFFRLLRQVVDDLQSDQDLANLFSGLSNFFHPTESVVEAFKSERFCRAAKGVFLDRRDHALREAILHLFQTLSSSRQILGELASASSVGLMVDYLRENQCDQCSRHVLSVLLTAAKASPKFRTILLDHGTILVVRKMEAEAGSEEVRQLCSDLQSRLTFTLPQHQAMAAKPLDPSEVPRGVKVVRPRCLWAEDRQRLLLTVYGRGLELQHFSITSSHISVDARVEDKHYKLDLDLMGSILVDQTLTKESGGSVVLDMRKATRGFWGSLLKTRRKMGNIEQDLEEMVDSSEEDLDEADIVPFRLHRDHGFPRPPPGWKLNLHDRSDYEDDKSEKDPSRSEDSLDEVLDWERENYYSDDDGYNGRDFVLA